MSLNITFAAEESCEERWVCTEWSPCDGGYMIRNCKDVHFCGIELNRPEEIEECGIVQELNFEEEIKGQIENVQGVTIPNPQLLIPTILLVVVLMSLLLLRHYDLSKSMKSIIGFLHIFLVAIIGFLLVATFVSNDVSGALLSALGTAEGISVVAVFALIITYLFVHYKEDKNVKKIKKAKKSSRGKRYKDKTTKKSKKKSRRTKRK